MQKKLAVIFCSFMAVFSLLYFRLSEISLNSDLMQVGIRQSSYTLSFYENRGQIYDCRFIPLVDESPAYCAAVLPSPKNFFLNQSSAFKDPAAVQASMQQRKPFIADTWLPLNNVPLVEPFCNPVRYSSSQLAQHVIGYIDKSSNSGITGIEKSYNDRLSEDTETSIIRYTLDAMGEPLKGTKPYVSLADIRTDGVVTTIDSRIQRICEESGARHIKKGAIVVMEPATGKIRAAASFPSYNANSLADAINDTEGAPLINRAYNAFPVGSTFKLVTAAAALSNRVSPYTRYTCTGSYTIGAVTFGCHEKGGHGELDMKEAIAVSCNPYFIHLSTLIDKAELLNMASDLSFGKASQLGEGIKTPSGSLPSIESLFNPGAVANVSFGQGELTATPIQVAQMISAIVNDGELAPASIIEGYTQDGKLLSEKYLEDIYPIKAMNQSASRLLKDYMVNAVMEAPNQNAKPNNTTAGGKTGTAQTGQFKDGNKKDELLQGWFGGFFPADMPKYVVVVTVEDCESGNQDASPVFREIADTITAPIIIPKDLRVGE